MPPRKPSRWGWRDMSDNFRAKGGEIYIQKEEA